MELRSSSRDKSEFSHGTLTPLLKGDSAPSGFLLPRPLSRMPATPRKSYFALPQDEPLPPSPNTAESGRLSDDEVLKWATEVAQEEQVASTREPNSGRARREEQYHDQG